MATAPKVLIVDDDRELTALLSAKLRDAGYHSVVAFDAMQGFMFAQRDLPRLILLDLNMPAGGGLKVLDRLRENTRTQGIPVVVISAEHSPQHEADAKAKGAVGFFTKPIEWNALLEQVKHLVESA